MRRSDSISAGPYVGITGFTTPDEVRRLLPLVPKEGERKLMVGVLVSDKTLRGEQNKHPNLFPPVARIKDIFLRDPRVKNLVHYSTDTPEKLGEQLWDLMSLAGPDIDGFQVNVTWPAEKELKVIRPWTRGVSYVIWIGGAAMEACGNDPIRVAEKLRSSYDACIATDVLVDPSGGLGKPFDVDHVSAVVRAIRKTYPSARVGVAGGLGPDTLSRIEPLVREFPRISIDAQGRLRNPDETLNRDAAELYLERAFKMFGCGA